MALGLRKGAKNEAATMQAMVEKKGKGCHSLPAGVAIGKAMQTQKGLLMGQPQNVGRRPQAPEVVHSGSILASLLSLGSPRVVKEEPEDESAQLWETQWQDFLSTVEVSPAPSRVPERPPESTPWGDAEAFLAAFEQVAEVFRWPREEWVARLLPTLTGEAELVFSSLEAGDREDYGKIKAALLQEDAVSRERSRQRFRNFCYQEAGGPREAYGRLRELCSRWLKIEKHSKEQILEVVILEQFVAILPPVIQKWVKEHQVESGVHAVSLVEEFLRRRWLSGVKEEQAAHPQGEGSMNFAEEEQVPLNTGEGPRLRKETKTEDLTDFSDAYLSADDGDGDDNDSLTQGSSHQTEPQEIFPESDNDPSSSCDQEKGNLRKSMETCEDGRKNLCSECGKSFPHKLSLQQHQRKHHMSHLPVKPPKDLTSGGGSHYKTDLESYQKILTGEYPCMCLHCGEKFTSRTSLVAHQKTHVGKNLPFSLPEVTVYICNECGETFNRLEDHNVHLRTHIGVRLVGYQKKTEWPSNQGKPLIVCAQEEPYRCTDCGESFVRLSTYRIHRITHSKSKPGSHLSKIPPWSKYCPVCQKAFSDYWKLKRHCATHKKPQEVDMCADILNRIPVQRRRGMRQKSFTCSECGKTFRWHAQLMKHKLIHSREKQYKCTPCGQRFVSSVSLGQHRKVVHKGGKPSPKFPTTPGKSSTCPTCGKSFKSYLARVVHERIHKGRKLHACSRCRKVFVLRKSLLSHEKKVHQVKTGGCPLAQAPKTGRRYKCLPTESKTYGYGKGLSNFSSFERPRKDPPKKIPDLLLKKTSSSGQKNLYICSKCGKCFNWLSQFKTHQNTHMKKKRFQCADCGKRFQWEISLDRHRKKFHCGGRKVPLPQTGPSGQEETHFCHDCGKFFKKRLYLIRHRRLMHHEQNVIDPKPRVYRCLECGMSFGSSLDLARHKDVHGREKLYKYTDRGKDFTQRSALAMYKEGVHKGKKLVPVLQRLPDLQGKPFKCSEQPGLVTLQATQTSSNSLACPECGKILSSRPSLQRHRILHTGLKPYKCDQCWKCFSYREYLVKHKRVHNRIQKVTMEVNKNNLQVKMNNGSQTLAGSSPPHMKSKDISHLWEEAGDECTAQVEELPPIGGLPAPSVGYGKGFSKLSSFERPRKDTPQKIPHPLLKKTSSSGQKNLCICSECGKCFNWPSQLKMHQNTHMKKKGFQCVDCGNRFQWEISLDRHRKKFHHGGKKVPLLQTGLSGQEKTHFCHDCGKFFKKRLYLVRHRRRLHHEKKVIGGSPAPTGGSPAPTVGSLVLTGCSLPHEKSEDASQLQEELGDACTVHVGELPQTGSSPAPTGSSSPHEKSEDASQLREELGDACTVHVGELPQTGSSPAPTGTSSPHEKSEDASQLQEELGVTCTVHVGELLQPGSSPAPTGSSSPHEKSEDASHWREEAGDECTVQVGELAQTDGFPAPTGSSSPHEKSEDASQLQEELGDTCTVHVGELPQTGSSPSPTGCSLLHEKSEDTSHWREEAGDECTVQVGELAQTDGFPEPTGSSSPHEKSEDASHLQEEAGDECTVQVGELTPTDGSPAPTGRCPPHDKSENTSHLWEEAGNECTFQVGELLPTGSSPALTGGSLPQEKSEDASHLREEAADECTVQVGELLPTDGSPAATGFSPALTISSPPHEKSEDAFHLWEEACNECTVQVGELLLTDGSLALTGFSPAPTSGSPPHKKSEDASHLREEAGDECTVQVGELLPTDGSLAQTGFSPALTTGFPPHKKSEDASLLWEETGDECTVQVGELLPTDGSPAQTGFSPALTSGSLPHEKSEDASHLREEAGDECTVQAGELLPTDGSLALTGFSPALTSSSLPHEKSEDAFQLWEEACNECTVQAGELLPTDGSLALTGFSPVPTSGSPPYKKSEDASHLWEEEGNECTVQVGELPLTDGSLAPAGGSPTHEKSEDASHWW